MSHNEIILDMFYLQEKPNTEAPEEFENAALLLRQGLSPAKLIRDEYETFSKMLFKPEEFENASIAF